MKVTCIARRGETLPDQYLDTRIPRTRDSEFHLTVGKEYVVYALAIRRGQIWYYVVDDTDPWFPINKPAPLFKVVDDRVSQHWRVKVTQRGLDHEVLFAFEEWVSDDGFYERLSDQEQAEWKVFKQWKERMDKESSGNLGLVRPQSHP